MTDSIATKLVKRGRRSLERYTHGEIGNIPGRTLTLSEPAFTKAVSSGLGRAELRKKVGVLGRVDWEGSGRGNDHLLTSGAGRREYAKSLKRGGK